MKWRLLIKMEINEDMEYLDENFPKGDKKRGVAMVLLSIARREGKCEVVKEYEKFLDDYKKEQRELVRQEFLEILNKRWESLFNVVNNLNISVYKKPISKETNSFVVFFRKEMGNEIKKLEKLKEEFSA